MSADVMRRTTGSILPDKDVIEVIGAPSRSVFLMMQGINDSVLICVNNVSVPPLARHAGVRSLAPLLRGRDEPGSLLEGWDEGTLHGFGLAESPPHPDFSLRVKSDLSPQAAASAARQALSQTPQLAPQPLARRGHRQAFHELHEARIFMGGELHLDEF